MKHLNDYIIERFRINKDIDVEQYTVKPKTKQQLREILKERLKDDKNADLNDIDVSNITDMDNIFVGLNARNIDISQWDVSNVTSMWQMFYGCRKFNCDLSKWDVSKVEDMNNMFYNCEEFNCDLSNWSVSCSQNSMHDMFFMCISMKKIPSWYKG